MENQSRLDIIKKRQSKLKRVKYSLLNMQAISDIGKQRNNQQDSVVLLTHPANLDFCLMAVADGMGGLENGALASNIALLDLIKWFEHIPYDYYQKEKNIYHEIDMILSTIDEHIRKECEEGGTTLALLIKSQKNTMMLNVGDSRIYIDSKKGFEQISEDHSITWDLYKKGNIKLKDDMRFHKENNLITSRLGCNKRKLTIFKTMLLNEEYNRAFLFSDGVTDCLSDEELCSIIYQYSDRVLEEICLKALSSISINNTLNKENYYDIISGGKDNLTAGLLIRK